MHVNRRVGTESRNINLYHFVNHDAAGSIDHDGYMRTTAEIHGRHSIGIVWNGFEALLTFGFRCEVKAARSDVDFTAAWKRKRDEQFSSRQHRVVSEIRLPQSRVANTNKHIGGAS